MRVFLVRHGRTSLNAAGLLRGQLDVPLDETGEAEAAALGKVFRHVPLAVVVSSPLRRALDTARHISSGSNSPRVVDDRLRDRFCGEWAGKTLDEVEERFGSVDAAPGVEPWQDFQSRTSAAFLDSLRTHSAENGGLAGVALVTHDAVLRALLRRLVPGLELARLELPTGSWTELEQSSGAPTWRTVHLGELPEIGQQQSSGDR
ncbi:MAG: histidine phosphatase family protein [Acidimicrobiales bacterium]|jgi:broad specificity phosphatase PhoE